MRRLMEFDIILPPIDETSPDGSTIETVVIPLSYPVNRFDDGTIAPHVIDLEHGWVTAIATAEQLVKDRPKRYQIERPRIVVDEVGDGV